LLVKVSGGKNEKGGRRDGPFLLKQVEEEKSPELRTLKKNRV